MTDVQYMNVWRSRVTDHQWTDAQCFDRELADMIAVDVHHNHGNIRRVGVLRVRLKEGVGG